MTAEERPQLQAHLTFRGRAEWTSQAPGLIGDKAQGSPELPGAMSVVLSNSRYRKLCVRTEFPARRVLLISFLFPSAQKHQTQKLGMCVCVCVCV